jgi:protein phosphatase
MTTWEPGNTLLICTDGLTNMVSEPNIFQLLNNRSGNGEFILDQLIEQAKNAGGFDNITAILAQYEDA